MNTDQLGYILEIHRSRSINKAAKNLFISQPSLSNALKSLEDELGYMIFERTSTGIRPTANGEVFLRFASRAFEEYNAVRSTPQQRFENNNLSITSASSSFFSHTFFQFKREHPSPSANQDIFLEATIYPTLQNVITNRTRLAFTYFKNSYKEKYEMYAKKNDLTMHVLKEALPIRVVVPVGHPLAKQDMADFHQLSEYPFVTYADVDNEDVLGTVDAQDEVLYVSSRATYIDAIRLGGYISISLGFAKGEEERSGCVCLPCKNYGDYYVATGFSQSTYTASPREAAFIAYLKDKLNDVGSWSLVRAKDSG